MTADDSVVTNPEIKKTNFKLFLAIWNRYQDLTTPDVHFNIASWLEDAYERNEAHLLLQAFRSCGKSSVVGVFAAWLLYKDPSLRILVLAADEMLAKKMVRNVKRIIERHPLTMYLRPEKIDQWGSDRFTVHRDLELRDPSMLAKGITSNITGSRADIIICDDVEVPKTCDTALKREELRQTLTETAFVLAAQGKQIYVGTPHTWYSIYSDVPRKDIGEQSPFLNDYERLTIPILDKKNRSAWPERYTQDDIAHIKRKVGPNKFRSQMMLEPVNIAEGYLNARQLRFYDAVLVKSAELKSLFLDGKRLVSCSAYWDPSFGGRTSDGSVLAVVFTDENGTYYLHHLEYIRIGVLSKQDDEATAQCRIVVDVLKKMYVPSVTVEINGIGRFLPNILRREIAKAGIACAVIELNNSTSKNTRIIEAFDAVMAARALLVNKTVTRTAFINEMEEWQPSVKNQSDDGLDAVAGALAREPIRLKRIYSSARQSWGISGTTSHSADTDFEI
jgi:predicted phage terminase large subunit-like protein